MIVWCDVASMPYAVLPKELTASYYGEVTRFLDWHRARVQAKFGDLNAPEINVAVVEARSPLLREKYRDHEPSWWFDVQVTHPDDADILALAWYRHKVALYRVWSTSDEEIVEWSTALDAKQKSIDALLFCNHPAHRVGVLVKYEHGNQYYRYLIGGPVTPDSDQYCDSDIPADAVVVAYADLLETAQ